MSPLILKSFSETRFKKVLANQGGHTDIARPPFYRAVGVPMGWLIPAQYRPAENDDPSRPGAVDRARCMALLRAAGYATK